MLRCLLFFCLLASGAAAAAPATYTLDDTEVRTIHAQALKRDYRLFVALPASYRTSSRRYPVVFVTDADYAFPVVRSIASRLSKHAGMEETIVVGLSYAQGDTGTFSRRRDYTPTLPSGSSYRSDMPGRAAAFGEGPSYARFITGEVVPLIGSQYRGDMQRTVFVGHSYGSLLGLQILLTEPHAFAHYILGSPSLWYGDGVMFTREQAYAAGHKDMPASVFFGIGSRETLARGKQRSHAEDGADMLADLRDFQARLASRHYPGLATRLEVFPDEDHASVFPFLLTHGLRAYFNEKK